MRIFFVCATVFLFTAHGFTQADPSIIKNEKNHILKEFELLRQQVFKPQDEYVLDSILTYTLLSETDSVLSTKQEYIYTEDWKQERIYYLWDEMAEVWLPDLHYILITDDDGNLIEYTRQIWDEALPGWVNLYQMTFEYNSAGQETFFLYVKWDEDLGDWENYMKEEYAYDAQGEMISLLSWMWDDVSGYWVGSYRNDWVFNGTGLLQERTLYTWDDDAGDWWASNREEYTYDPGGLLILSDGFDHSEVTGLWIHNLKTEYYNNEQGLPDSLYRYHSVTNGTTWDLSGRTTMTYDSGNMTLTISSSWNSNASSWEYNSKSEIGWDEYGNRVLDKGFMWDETLPGWQLMNMTERQYNAAGDALMYATYSYNSELGAVIGVTKMTYSRHPAGHILFRNDYLWDLDLSAWHLDGRGFYYYTVYTDIAEYEEPFFDLFPNPVASMLHLRFDREAGVTYGIYTPDGSKVNHGTGYGSKLTVDVADLPQGAYLILVRQEGIQIGRLFIKH